MNSRLPLLTGSEFVKILRPIPMAQLSLHTEDRQCPLCTDAYESSDEFPCLRPLLSPGLHRELGVGKEG